MNFCKFIKRIFIRKKRRKINTEKISEIYMNDCKNNN